MNAGNGETNNLSETKTRIISTIVGALEREEAQKVENTRRRNQFGEMRIIFYIVKDEVFDGVVQRNVLYVMIEDDKGELLDLYDPHDWKQLTRNGNGWRM